MDRYPMKDPSPKDLNKIFNQVLLTNRTPDYEDIVDNIMHLCPTYSIGLGGSKEGKESEDVSSCTNTFNRNHKKFLSRIKTSAESFEEV